MGILLENCIYDILAITISLIAVVIAYFKWKYMYWERRGSKNTLKPTFPFGNVKSLITNKLSIGNQLKVLYNECKAKGYEYGALYFLSFPLFIPIHPELIKHIIQTDFQHFRNRGLYINEEVDPLTGNLFLLEDEKWKNMRMKLSQTFTSVKIKMMFQIVAKCANGLKLVCDDYLKKQEPIEIKDVLARFTTDVIGSTAFGLECNSLKDPNTQFRVEGNKLFVKGYFRLFKIFLQFALPMSVLKFMRVRITPPSLQKFFMDVIRKTIDYREKNNIQREDFIHLLIQMKNKRNDENNKDNAPTLTFNEIVGQCFGFFIGGFETSATTIAFALYELSKNQEVQQKTRDEINTVLEKYDGQLTYEALADMKYLEQVINEALRMHPVTPILHRLCNKDYKIPGSDVIVEKGTVLMISVSGIHRDAEHFPNPHKFDPDRFSEKNKKNIPRFAFIPFGDGPRACTGIRFGIMQTKIGLVTILKNYKFTLNEKTIDPLVYDTNVLVTSPVGGIWLNLEKA